MKRRGQPPAPKSKAKKAAEEAAKGSDYQTPAKRAYFKPVKHIVDACGMYHMRI